MQNETERQRLACPIYKEICVKGHTKSMGEDADGCQTHCRWWIHVVGKDPQSNKDIDLWDCSISWLPILQVETTQRIMQGTASQDKTANVIFEALPQPTQQRIMLKNPIDPQMVDGNQKLLDEKQTT